MTMNQKEALKELQKDLENNGLEVRVSETTIQITVLDHWPSSVSPEASKTTISNLLKTPYFSSMIQTKMRTLKNTLTQREDAKDVKKTVSQYQQYVSLMLASYDNSLKNKTDFDKFIQEMNTCKNQELLLKVLEQNAHNLNINKWPDIFTEAIEAGGFEGTWEELKYSKIKKSLSSNWENLQECLKKTIPMKSIVTRNSNNIDVPIRKK